MMRALVFSILIVVAGVSTAQQPAVVISEVLQEMQKTIDEKNENLAFWRSTTATAISLARQKAIEELRAIAKTAATAKQTETAKEANRAILEIESSQKEAQKSDSNQGQLKEVKTKVDAVESTQKSDPIARVQYKLEDGSTYQKQPDGTWTKTDSKGENKRTLKEVERNRYSVTLRENSRHHQMHQLLANQVLWAWQTGWKKGSRTMLGSGYWSK